MTGMKRLIGMPVICEGKHIGSIVRGVLRSDGKALRGLVMRDGCACRAGLRRITSLCWAS